MRLLRFFKLSRYSPGLQTLLRVLRNERRSLSAAGRLQGDDDADDGWLGAMLHR